jgi:hypothetical protein
MAKGHPCTTKFKRSVKDQTKLKLSDNVADKTVEGSSSLIKCLECSSVIADDARALNCERCTNVWKCSCCIGIKPGTYDDLVGDGRKELFWFCEPCRLIVSNPEKDEKVMTLMLQLAEQLNRLEKKLDAKVEVERVEVLEDLVKKLNAKLDTGYDGMMSTLEKSKLDVKTVQGCVQGALLV